MIKLASGVAPSPAQLRAFLDHIETAGIRDRRKTVQAVIAGWKAAMEIETTTNREATR